MIQLEIKIEEHDKQAAALEAEHISQLIMNNYTSGRGWKLTGEEEGEPKVEILSDKKEENENV